MRARYVLVGVDDRPDAVWAGRFGADQAVARGLGLMLAYGYAAMPVLAQTPGGPDTDRLRRATAAVQKVASQIVPPAAPAIETVVDDSLPLDLLARLAGDADRIVIGQHHLTMRERIPDPSLASQLADVVRCPLVVVPSEPRLRDKQSPVVVALDGETDAHSALEIAFDEAERRQAMVLALHAAPLASLRSGHADDERDLAEILAGRKADHPDLPVRAVVSAADPSDLIVKASRDAAVLVVGRPHDPHRAAWSRSVAGAVLKLARCPLIIGTDQAATDEPSRSPASQEVSWPLDGTIVDATLVTPAGHGPFPAIVMVAGSGPTDRNWNSPLLPGTNGSAHLLADALSGAGFASLRYDKRASGPRARENVQVLAGKISMQSHLDELSGAVRALAQRDEVDADRVFAIANSEGALHALNYQIGEPAIPLAGLVLIGPPGRAIGVVARAQIAAGAAALPNGNALMSLYDAAIERFLAGDSVVPDPSLPDTARNLLLGLTAPVNQPFSRELWMADAARLLPKAHVPMLIVIGRKDVQVDRRADGELLEKAADGRSDVTFLFPENANHVLKYEPRPRAELTGADAAGYNAPDTRLDPEALASVLGWLEAQARQAPPRRES